MMKNEKAVVEHITATILVLLLCAGWIALVTLAVRAPRTYLKSEPVRREKSEMARTRGVATEELLWEANGQALGSRA